MCICIYNRDGTYESIFFLNDQTVEAYVRNSSLIPKYFKKMPIGVRSNPIPPILLTSLFFRFLNLSDACIKVTAINKKMSKDLVLVTWSVCLRIHKAVSTTYHRTIVKG